MFHDDETEQSWRWKVKTNFPHFIIAYLPDLIISRAKIKQVKEITRFKFSEYLFKLRVSME
jgi:hypothetical protein